MARFTGLLGLAVLLAVAYALSTDRRAIRWRTVAWGLTLQILFAFLVLKWTFGQAILHTGAGAVTSLLAHSVDGSRFVFGPLGDPTSPLEVLAFAVLPTIIFVSALFAVLYHLGIMQWVIRGMAWLMQRTMGTSGAESTNVAASIFMGQTEAPLTIRPFLAGATRSELMCIMTSGMAHVSGGIMAAYISFGIRAQDLLSAVIMTAPGTILVAKMLVPETEVPATLGTVHIPAEEAHKDENLIGSIARGTIDGGKLAFNVAIMLVSFLALIGLLNAVMLGISNLLWAHGHIPFPHSLGNALGTLCAPVAWLIGIPWTEANKVGNLLGTRAVLNEFIAYTQLGAMAKAGAISTRTLAIATFALCGFANIGSVGMQIGGIGALIPTRRNELARLGLRAMLAGTMANLMSASIVSMLLPPLAESTMPDLYDRAQAAAAHIRRHHPTTPTLGLVLGSGLGNFANQVETPTTIPYNEIPHWPRSTVEGHAGKLVLGAIQGTPVAVMAGRVHAYEGYPLPEVTFPTRVLGLLGCRALILTNAAGGLNPAYAQGTLVALSDHINLTGANAAAGPNEPRFAINPQAGLRFFDMSHAYSPRLRALAHTAADALDIPLPEGVYCAVLGPSFETPAEIRAFRTLGADLVGMSTVHETVIARHMGLEVLGLSLVTNMAAGLSATPIHHEEVMETGARTEAQFTALLTSLIPRIAATLNS